jgi:hypothetical protein
MKLGRGWKMQAEVFSVCHAVTAANIHTQLLRRRRRFFSEVIARKRIQSLQVYAGGHALAAIATLSLMRSPFQKMPWHAIRSVISFSAAHSHTSFNIKCVISANGLIASQARRATHHLLFAARIWSECDSDIARLSL